MSAIAVSSIISASILGSGLVGMAVGRVIPGDDLGSSEKEIARLVAGLITTMSAIVLGMLVSSAKSSFDARTNEVAEISSDVVTIDRMLARYGTETAAIRGQFRLLVGASVERIWPVQAPVPVQVELKPRDDGEILIDQLRLLAPQTAAQTESKAQAIRLIVELRQTQWMLFLKAQRSGIPIPLLIIVVAWLALVFFSFGVFTQASRTIVVTLLLGAVTVSTAILIILELYTPFRGVLKISSDPIREALSQMKG